MRELVGGKNTIGRIAAVLKGPMKRPLPLPFNLCNRWGGWSMPRPGLFTPGKDPVPIVQEAGWAPGTVWTGAENLAPTGIRFSDRPTRSNGQCKI